MQLLIGLVPPQTKIFKRSPRRALAAAAAAPSFTSTNLAARGLAQAFIPSEELWGAYATLAAKPRHVLPAPGLLGNHLPPLPPRLLSALSHAARLLSPAAIRKIPFTYRSHKNYHSPSHVVEIF